MLDALGGYIAANLVALATGASKRYGEEALPGLLQRMRSVLKRPHVVLVTGSTGVGKTSVVNALMETPQIIERANRTKDLRRYNIEIDRNLFQFVDAPGQELHRRKWMDFLKKIRGRKIGVLDVVAAGLHEYDRDIEEAVTTKGSIRRDWLIKHREQENRQLRLTLNDLEDVGAEVQWIATVVNKADLWWSDKDAVLEDYASSAYRACVEALGVDWDDEDVLPFCACAKRFFDHVPISERFDDRRRLQLLEHLTSRLIELVLDTAD